MSVAQHQGFAADTNIDTHVVGTGTNVITLSNDGTIDARNQIEGYVLNGDGVGGSTVNINAATFLAPSSNLNVSITGAGGADKVSINSTGFGMSVGGAWALAGADDILFIDANDGTGDVNITGVNGGAATTAETLTLANNGDDVTMTSAQHNGFTTVNSPAVGANNDGGRNVFTVSNTGTGVDTIVGFAGIDGYSLTRTSTGSFDFAIGENGQDVTATAGDDIIRSTASADNLNGSIIDGGLGNDTLVLDDGDTTVGATLTSLELLSVSGSVTMTGLQYDNFAVGNVKGTGATDSMTLTTGGNFDATTQATVADNIEHYVLNGASTITFAGTDAVRAAQSVDFTAATGDLIIKTTAVESVLGGTDSSISVSGFSTSANNLTVFVGGTQIVATGANNFNDVTAGTNTALTGLTNSFSVIVVNGLANTDLNDISNNGDVETAIGNAIGSLDAGTYLVILEDVDSGASNQSGAYLITLGSNVANLDSTNFDVEYVAHVDHGAFTTDWTSASFA